MPAFQNFRASIGKAYVSAGRWITRVEENNLNAIAAQYRPRGAVLNDDPLTELLNAMKKVSEERGRGIF